MGCTDPWDLTEPSCGPIRFIVKAQTRGLRSTGVSSAHYRVLDGSIFKQVVVNSSLTVVHSRMLESNKPQNLTM